MVHISDYDKFEYKYEQYWKNRPYEDKAEKVALVKYFHNIEGKFFVDIGGSFGRHLNIYHDKFTYPIILDYSLKTLQRNREEILKNYPKTKLIAANAYNIPFKKNTVETTMMIRVLHHIENQASIFQEIKRIGKNNSYLILEYANKMHIKAILRWIISFKFYNFSTKPYQQPNQNNFEGTNNTETTVFLNYHPKYIQKELKNSCFQIIRTTNCSFLRMNFFKKMFSNSFILKLEKVFQKLFSWTNIAPSIIIKSIQRKNEEENKNKYQQLEDILCCPICKNDLEFKKSKANCKKCSKTFNKERGVWDLRA